MDDTQARALVSEIVLLLFLAFALAALFSLLTRRRSTEPGWVARLPGRAILEWRTRDWAL